MQGERESREQMLATLQRWYRGKRLIDKNEKELINLDNVVRRKCPKMDACAKEFRESGP